MMRFYHYAGESRRGASEALYHAYADRLEALLATPRLTGKVKGLNDARALLSRCEALIASAAAEFAALERGDAPRRLRRPRRPGVAHRLSVWRHLPAGRRVG